MLVLIYRILNFKNNGIKIRRKGGYEAVIYFGEEVETALLDYLEQRNHIIPAEGNENALFLSLQNKRISVRAVEKLVKKYASLVTNLKKITPHKLRSTYGTSLYRETGDIYLVCRCFWVIKMSIQPGNTTQQLKTIAAGWLLMSFDYEKIKTKIKNQSVEPTNSVE